MRAVYGDAPKYKMVFGNSLLPFDDGHGNETKIFMINNQLHLKYKGTTDGGISAYIFSIYDPSTETMTNIYAPVNDESKKGHGAPLYTSGTHLLEEMKNFVISTNPRSPDGYFFSTATRLLEKRGLDRELYVSSAIDLPHKVELPDYAWQPSTQHFNPKLTLSQHLYKNRTFYGWLVNENAKEIPKMKHSLLLSKGQNCEADFFGISGKRPLLKVIDAQLHVTIDPKGSAGVCGFMLELYKNMYDQPEYISINTMRLSAGTHLIEETSQYKIFEQQTSPEGFIYDPQNWTLTYKTEKTALSRSKFFNAAPTPEEFVFGWAIDENALLPPKPQYKAVIGYPTGLVENDTEYTAGNYVHFFIVDGKINIHYRPQKSKPYRGYTSYAISVYDFETQTEKTFHFPLITKSGHAFDEGLHPLKELSNYKMSIDSVAPDSSTFIGNTTMVAKDGYNIPLTLPADNTTSEQRRLEGKFLGWVIEEE